MAANLKPPLSNFGGQGTSSLFNGERRPKNDNVFEALGTNDELTSYIGLAMEYTAEDTRLDDLQKRINKVQCILQDINSNIATPRQSSSPARLAFDSEGYYVQELEQWIDDYDTKIPPLKNFILPSGGKLSCTLHIARCVCRRAERRVTDMLLNESVDPGVAKYLNRLSDFLFTAARYACFVQGKKDNVYVKPKKNEKPST